MNPFARQRPRQPLDAAAGADRVLGVLKRMCEHPRGVGLDELARELELPKSSLHRALAALRRAGLVEQDERGRYRVALELVRLASVYYEALDKRAHVEPTLRALADRFGETAHYGELYGAEVVYVAKVAPAGRSVHMTSAIGGRNPAHCTGLGKVLLAHALGADGAVERYVAQHGPLARRTAATLVEVEELAAELGATRARGYAVDDEESEEGITCIAFPVFLDSAARPSGAISVAALVHRTPAPTLVAAADEIRTIIEQHLGPVTR
jgi:DNA-binding IclR family transcriptional regulator